MLVAANGDIFVSETGSGRVSVLRPGPDGTQAMSTDVYAQGLEQPSGLAFYPNAKHARRLYIAEKMPKRSPTEIQAWEAGHGLGAAWGDETGRAAVLVLSPAPPTTPKTFATGLRNCVGLTLQAATGSLWCTVNERNLLGDDLVPDYSTRLHAGGFYGWPWYYWGAHEDPRLKGDRPDLASMVSIPDVPYQSHSAPLSLTFYAASSGASAFPRDYIGDAFAAFHGSWNRSLRTGYKLVRVLFKDGQPTGEYRDFLTGFIADDGNVWGRPVATAQLADGSLLVSDDAGGVVYRISYSAQWSSKLMTHRVPRKEKRKV